MADILRAIRSNPLLRGLAARLGAGYIRLVHRTVRWTILGPEAEDAVRHGPDNVILGIWHGRLLAVPALMTRQLEVHAIISANRDGELIAAAVKRFGIDVIRGSSADRRKPDKDKQGREALEAALEKLKGDRRVIVALTPDGPRGPRMRCQPGIALLSARTGKTVYPWAYATRRAKVLRSWDRFMLPLPFDRGVILFGRPVPAPTSDDPATIEEHRLRIEAAMLEAAHRVDTFLGRDPIVPDDRPGVTGGGLAPWPPAPEAEPERPEAERAGS
ncbi:lysophospholipid acyltransferase family protein [Rhodovulum sp. DZ06]|uniref:lysophospholipid acyltransferase family protein n=1 Tax=Rhodovulum sp. DZ06 TaxID=3425126 RepID=UPI003D34A610